MRFLLLMAILFSVLTVLDSEDIIKVGVFLHPPYVEQFNDRTDLQGAGIEYISAVFNVLGYGVQFELQPFARLIHSLANGTVDMAFDLTKNPERELFLLYSEEPILNVVPVLIFRNEFKIETIHSIFDLQGMNIGSFHGVTMPEFFDVPDVVNFDISYAINGINSNISKLLAKRIDASLDLNPYSFLREAGKMGVLNQIKVIPLPVVGINYYVVFSKKSQMGITLHSEYNEFIKTNTMEYEQYLSDYLKSVPKQ